MFYEPKYKIFAETTKMKIDAYPDTEREFTENHFTLQIKDDYKTQDEATNLIGTTDAKKMLQKGFYITEITITQDAKTKTTYVSNIKWKAKPY